MSTIRGNIKKIRENIAEAAVRSGRNVSDVKLMGVTKTVDDARIIEAIEAGIDIIGENYVQEGKRKIEKMGKGIEWHMIGHLQSNKSKYAIKLFDLIHSVDRMSLARELDKRSGNAGLKTKILVEVNVSGEETKSGIRKEDALSLIKEITGLRNLTIRGLMTMPPWFDNPEDARPYFVSLRELRDRIIEEDIPDVVMKELSMGMSGDYRVAVEEGATIVRIGTAIFGERVY
ncbi:MAG: YggS family pyridoxal phosphate-dependent enzyme [Deltaproteobacteria bacterium]|nr:YggS family pyridoxal phosphate-dependent enzyme [Deltaproteobacteria bacterium]